MESVADPAFARRWRGGRRHPLRWRQKHIILLQDICRKLAPSPSLDPPMGLFYASQFDTFEKRNKSTTNFWPFFKLSSTFLHCVCVINSSHICFQPFPPLFLPSTFLQFLKFSWLGIISAKLITFRLVAFTLKVVFFLHHSLKSWSLWSFCILWGKISDPKPTVNSPKKRSKKVSIFYPSTIYFHWLETSLSWLQTFLHLFDFLYCVLNGQMMDPQM